MAVLTPQRQRAAQVPESLLRAVVAYFDPVRVILFGSRARGEAAPDSDYDLLVILDDDAPAEKLRLEAGYEAARPSGVAADVIPCRARTFEAKRDVVGSLAQWAASEGVIVFER